jgi:hypothetical protein
VIEDGAGLHRVGSGFDWIEDFGIRCFEPAVPDDLSESSTRLSRMDRTYAEGEQVVASRVVDTLAGGDGKSIGRYL